MYLRLTVLGGGDAPGHGELWRKPQELVLTFFVALCDLCGEYGF